MNEALTRPLLEERMIRRTYLALATALLVAASVTHAFQTPAPSVTGTWTGKFIIAKDGAPPAQEGAYAVLTQVGSTITGTIGPSAERQFDISNGKIVTTKDDTTVTFESGQGAHRIFYTAKLTADQLKGTVKDEFYKTTLQMELNRSK